MISSLYLLLSRVRGIQFMPRELNTDLFQQDGTYGNSVMGATPVDNGHRSSAETVGVSHKTIHEMQQQIQQLKKQLRDLEAGQKKLSNRMDEVVLAVRNRMQRLGHVHKNLEHLLQTKFQEVAARVSTLSSRLTEHRVSETKIEEMVDRHHRVVQGFESKFQQMQKVMSEHEFKVLNLSAIVKGKQPPQ